MVRGSPQTILLGKNIRARRKQLGMTQEKLADLIGMAYQSVSRIEQGHIAPKMENLPRVAKALQCTVADLFRAPDEAQASYANRMADLLSGLPTNKQEYVFQHISSLIFLLKLEE